MGIYAEYINKFSKGSNWPELEKERKTQLLRISAIRDRSVLVYASALNKQADISISYEDRISFQDQLSNINLPEVDVILETPGGSAEIAEDLVNMLRTKFSKVGMIIPGYAKSAGTIMAMSGDEILMEPSSALGPIDAQMMQNNKRFSAHAFLEGLKKIKEEVIKKITLIGHIFQSFRISHLLISKHVRTPKISQRYLLLNGFRSTSLNTGIPIHLPGKKCLLVKNQNVQRKSLLHYVTMGNG